MRTPAAPTVTVEKLSGTSVKLTITAASAADFNVTYRYIVYTSDSIGGLIESGGGRGGYSADADPRYVTLTGLTAGRTYDIYVAPFTGSTGTTTANASGYPGAEGYVSTQTVADYAFAFGKVLHIGTNGYIGLDSGSTSDSISSTTGTVIGIFPKDLYQSTTTSVWYWSDSTEFRIRWEGYDYNNPSNLKEYEIVFNINQNYANVYAINVTSAAGTSAWVKDGVTKTNYAAALTTGAWRQIYFDGVTNPGSLSGPYVPKSKTVMKQVTGLTAGTQDQGYTSITTSTNQNVTPTAPIINTPNGVTPGPQGGPVSVAFTGGSGPFYQMFWWGTATAPTGITTPDGSGSSSPLQDATGPTSTATQYMYVRSVATQSDTSVANTTTVSPWSAGVAFNMTSTAVTQSTAPTAKATSNNSTTIVKYGDSITWAAGTYTNAASITSVLLYSTNTSNLVSTGGDTSSSTRTSNPYVIQTNDPTGTPYVFAVRDVVVGTNGTTYYFYSNQITSALADAVAFSYNAGVGAAGGWSATVVTAQSGATYSINAATGYSVNSSNGTVTVTGLGSNASTSILVTKSVAGTNNTTATAAGTSDTVPTYSLTYSANGGSSTPSQQNGIQGASITLASGAGTLSGYTFGGWSIGGTTYSGSGSYTFGSANATATAIWNVVFVAPTSSAPSMQFSRKTTATTHLQWYCDYPSISGDGTITGMEWEIRTTAGGGTLLASGTRAYPGSGVYPYSAGGTIWAFRMGTTNGDITYSSSARYGRGRVKMLGSNGTTYYSAYSAWL